MHATSSSVYSLLPNGGAMQNKDDALQNNSDWRGANDVTEGPRTVLALHAYIIDGAAVSGKLFIIAC